MSQEIEVIKICRALYSNVQKPLRGNFMSLKVYALLGFFLVSPSCTKQNQDKASLPDPKVPVSPAPVSEASKDKGTASEVSSAPDLSTQGQKESKEEKSENGLKQTQDTGQVGNKDTPVAESEDQYRLVGEVVAQRKSQLAFKVAGFIESTEVKPGVFVKKGGILAKLENRDFKLRLDLAKIKRDGAKVALESANREYKREVALKEENASTESSFDKIKNGFDQASIALRLAELDLKNAENSLNDSFLVAPYDCVVAAQLKYEGENVQVGTAVFDVYDIANPELTLRAPEKLLGQITIGESILVKVPSAGYSGTAKVVRIVPVVNEKTRTFSVTAQFENINVKLVPGLFAEGLIKKQPRTKI